MNVTGSLALQSGAFYMVQINPATSSFADVTGAATLGGSTVKAIYANGSYIEKQYTILSRRRRQRHVRLGGRDQPAVELSFDAEL